MKKSKKVLLSFLSALLLFSIFNFYLMNKIELYKITLLEIFIILFVIGIQVLLILIFNKKVENIKKYIFLTIVLIIPTLILVILNRNVEKWNYLGSNNKQQININLELSPMGVCNFYYNDTSFKYNTKTNISAYGRDKCVWHKEDNDYSITIQYENNEEEINCILKNNSELHCSSTLNLNLRILKKD